MTGFKRITIEQRILEQLDMVGGFTTGQVAKKLGCPDHLNNAQWSARVRYELRMLQQRRLVRSLDDLKPVAWVKTLPKPPAM